MAAITRPMGPFSKNFHYRAAVTATTYPGTAQFILSTFRAKGMLFVLESATRIASFSYDGTNNGLVMNGAHIKSVVYDDFHQASVFIKMDDAAGATVMINAWA